MQQGNAVLAIVAMFVVRMGLPVLLLMALGWWLSRLDARWSAEARVEHAALHWGERAAFGDGGATAVVSQKPCWVTRNCSDEQRSGCSAYRQPTLPCWLVRFRREGRLPSGCVGCQLFAAMQGGV